MKRMKMKFLASLAAAVTSLFGAPFPAESKAISKAPTNATPAVSSKPANELAWKIYRAVGTKGDNVFVSPASISTAIGLAFEGSSGATRAKARKFLTLKEAGEKESLVPTVRKSFENSGDSITLRMQNAVWTDPAKVDPTPEYIKRADTFYSAKVAKAPFGDGVKLSEEINAWVKKATNGMIDRLVAPDDLRERHLAILNAVYFLGTWKEPFEESRTIEDDFTTTSGAKVRAQLMNNTDHFAYAETDRYQLLHLPYKNQDYVMSIILPKQGLKLSDVESNLTAGAFETPGEPREVWVQLPKFKIDWGVENILPDLVSLGMPNGGPQEEFKVLGAKDMIILTAVLHRAVVKVDEKGTEAAAATAIMALGGSAPSKKTEFHCDRPFLFAIRDVKRNEILFIGRFGKP
ncbi:MAG: serpin family protein [Bdellovibrionota bacterium]